MGFFFVWSQAISVIRQKAESAAIVAFKDKQAIDPAFIFLLIQVIIEVIKLWRSCRMSANQAIDNAARPGIFGTIRLRRIVRVQIDRHLPFTDSAVVEVAVRAIGKEITVDEMEAAFIESETPPPSLYAGLA